jgi:biotin transport system substrate-specific component
MPNSAPSRRTVPASGGDVRRGGPTGLRDTALVAVFAALVVVLSLLPGIALGPVPITLQTLGVLLAGLVLGPWRGATACLLYLLLGFVGLPVFSGGASGLGVLAGASAGYLVSFPVGALVAGALARASTRWGWQLSLGVLVVAGVAGTAVIHAAGILGLVRAGAFDTLTSAAAFDATFWPGDLLKAVVAAAIAATVHRAYPALLGRRR